jgi:predicted DNA-binding protein (MmcQ/YjbR family)
MACSLAVTKATVDNLSRLASIAAELPEAVRVDVAAWDDHPTFRVRGKNFLFSDQFGSHITIKLTAAEAEAVTATDPAASDAGYGLGRHGWIAVTITDDETSARWRQIREWIRTSYQLVAPRQLAVQIEAAG